MLKLTSSCNSDAAPAVNTAKEGTHISATPKKMAQKIAPWRILVVYGVMFLFVIGIPSLPRPHHLVYWVIAFILEAALCLALLPFRNQTPGDHSRS